MSIKCTLSNFKKKVRAGYAIATAGSMAMLTPVVSATGSVAGGNNSNASSIQGADEIVGSLVGTICSIFMYIGILLLVWAVGSLVLAFKNEDADSKSRSMMLLVVALILIVLKPIVAGILQATGASITIS